jgi:hypothetical protein
MRGFVRKNEQKGQLNFLEKSCEKSKKSRTAEATKQQKNSCMSFWGTDCTPRKELSSQKEKKKKKKKSTR